MTVPYDFFMARFYVTNRCNSKCVYCEIWRKDGQVQQQTLSLADAKKLLYQLRALGVAYIDFTGGEPTLYPHLEELLLYAKELGIRSEVTTNGIPVGEDGVEKLLGIARAAAKFNVSLDTTDPDRYHKIRGVDRYADVCRTLEALRSGRCDFKLMTVVTKENVHELDDVLALGRSYGAPVYLSPVFSYGELGREGESRALLGQVRAKAFDPYAIVLLQFLKLFEEADVRGIPPCSANRSALTIGPDGGLLLPCHHACRQTIPWEGDLPKMLESEAFSHYRQVSGRLDCCKGCAVLPYMGVTFSRRMGPYFLLQSYSERLRLLKGQHLNPLAHRLHFDRDLLLAQQNQLIEIVNSLPVVDLQGDESKRYGLKQWGKYVYTDVYRGRIFLDHYLEDQRQKECWQLPCAPHQFFDRIARSAFPALAECCRSGSQEGGAAERLLSQAMEFQLRLWKVYVSRYLRAAVTCDLGEESRWIGQYLADLRQWNSRQLNSGALERDIAVSLAVFCPEDAGGAGWESLSGSDEERIQRHDRMARET